MNAMTIKLSPELDLAVQKAALQQRIAKSELVRRALTRYLSSANTADKGFVSAADLAGDLIGSVDGGPGDLATNPRYMDDFGK